MTPRRPPIVGSEAFDAKAHVNIRVPRRDLQEADGPTLGQCLLAGGATAAVGIGASLIDVWLGHPIALALVVIGFIWLRCRGGK